MGQYFKVVNLDKREFLHPHRFGDGLKLLEFGCSGSGTMTGLAILLADGNGRGGGDLQSENPIIGSWAGDRIVIAGDYADAGSHIPEDMISDLGPKATLYTTCSEGRFRDVSNDVLLAMVDDRYIRENLKETLGKFGDSPSPELKAKLESCDDPPPPRGAVTLMIPRKRAGAAK